MGKTKAKRKAVPAKAKAKAEVNKWFPGRPNYVGPTKGWFAVLHHEVLAEYSENVMERVKYVETRKPKKEVPTRLRNMMYLGKELSELLTAAYFDWHSITNQTEPWNESKLPPYGCHALVLAKMKQIFPDHMWKTPNIRDRSGYLTYPDGSKVLGS